MTTPQEALKTLREQIESQGPNTPNRHYGRRQYLMLLGCCDIIANSLDGDEGDEGEDDVDVESLDLNGLLALIAESYLEDLDDMDQVSQAWLTADDIASRLRGVLQENDYWWTP